MSRQIENWPLSIFCEIGYPIALDGQRVIRYAEDAAYLVRESSIIFNNAVRTDLNEVCENTGDETLKLDTDIVH